MSKCKKCNGCVRCEFFHQYSTKSIHRFFKEEADKKLYRAFCDVTEKYVIRHRGCLSAYQRATAEPVDSQYLLRDFWEEA